VFHPFVSISSPEAFSSFLTTWNYKIQLCCKQLPRIKRFKYCSCLLASSNTVIHFHIAASRPIIPQISDLEACWAQVHIQKCMELFRPWSRNWVAEYSGLGHWSEGFMSWRTTRVILINYLWNCSFIFLFCVWLVVDLLLVSSLSIRVGGDWCKIYICFHSFYSMLFKVFWTYSSWLEVIFMSLTCKRNFVN